MCDLWMIQNSTQIEAAIIGADISKLKLNICNDDQIRGAISDWTGFLLVEFLYATPILALVNNGLKYCINRLQLNLRYKISSYLTDNYLKGNNCVHQTWKACSILKINLKAWHIIN